MKLILILAISITTLAPFTQCFQHQEIVEDCIKELKQLQDSVKNSSKTKN